MSNLHCKTNKKTLAGIPRVRGLGNLQQPQIGRWTVAVIRRRFVGFCGFMYSRICRPATGGPGRPCGRSLRETERLSVSLYRLFLTVAKHCKVSFYLANLPPLGTTGIPFRASQPSTLKHSSASPLSIDPPRSRRVCSDTWRQRLVAYFSATVLTALGVESMQQWRRGHILRAYLHSQFSALTKLVARRLPLNICSGLCVCCVTFPPLLNLVVEARRYFSFFLFLWEVSRRLQDVNKLFTLVLVP